CALPFSESVLVRTPKETLTKRFSGRQAASSGPTSTEQARKAGEIVMGIPPVYAFLTGMLLSVVGGAAWAAPGDLDTTFDDDGVNPISSNGFTVTYAPDSTGGSFITASGGSVRRYTHAGALDTGFGSGGEATISQFEAYDGTNLGSALVD